MLMKGMESKENIIYGRVIFNLKIKFSFAVYERKRIVKNKVKKTRQV